MIHLDYAEHHLRLKDLLSGKVGGGFGERKRHCLDDFGDFSEPSLGDGSRFAYQYGRPEKLSDII